MLSVAVWMHFFFAAMYRWRWLPKLLCGNNCEWLYSKILGDYCLWVYSMVVDWCSRKVQFRELLSHSTLLNRLNHRKAAAVLVLREGLSEIFSLLALKVTSSISGEACLSHKFLYWYNYSHHYDNVYFAVIQQKQRSLYTNNIIPFVQIRILSYSCLRDCNDA